MTENTPVFLTGRQYSANGIARTCKKDASSFVLAILLDQESSAQSGSVADPGIFAVDDFLTEEQEAEILENFNRETPGAAAVIAG